MKNNSDYTQNTKYTLESAMEAEKRGLLKEWVVGLLRSEKNFELAEKVVSEKIIALEMIHFPLAFLNKIQGPEEIETHRQSPAVWEEKVKILADRYGRGFMPAPIIVTDFWNHFEIADGNHRHEALERRGVASYWTIFFIKHKEGKKYLEKIIKENTT